MTLRRIPHQFVLALAFGFIAVVLAAVIVRNTQITLGSLDETSGYARAEVAGITYIGRTHAILRALIAYRDARTSLPATGGVAQARSISDAIGALCDGTPENAAMDAAIADDRERLRRAWARATAKPHPPAAAMSAAIAAVPPLLVAIHDASGIVNDPSIDGINLGDALVRFPVSLAQGGEAATIALTNLQHGDPGLARRFSAARLLAQAQMAVDVGAKDTDDELTVNAALGPAVKAAAAANRRDFGQLSGAVTRAYVEATPTTGPPRTAGLTALRRRFAASSFAAIDLLRRDLLDVTRRRVAATLAERRQLVAMRIGAVFLEALLMFTLAWFSVASYRSQRERTIAERKALESERAGLEVQLTNAKAQQALLRAQAQFRAVFDRAPTGMIIVDRLGVIFETNEAAQQMLGSGSGRIDGRDLIADHAPFIAQMFSGAAADAYAQEWNLSGSGSWFHVSISPVQDESGSVPFAIVMLRDITESKQLEAQLVFEAAHDLLTGLPNRKRLLMLLQDALDRRYRDGAIDVFSVIFIDFNDFKTINDSFGHQAGDQFLIDGAARLRQSVRATDVVARIGGDEFAVIMHGVDQAEIERSVARLQTVVAAPVNIEGQLVASSASFGIAPADRSYLLAAELIRDADTAMYQAKADGGRNYVVFDMTMRERVVRRMQLSIDIVHALEHDELELLYQPIVDLEDGCVAGCEALLRWRRSDGLLVSPAEFLPLAEENGSIIEIGRWVVATACEQLRRWNAAGAARLPGFGPNFVMHVNLAVPEVHHIDLLPALRSIVTRTGVRREQLILEITEGIILRNTEPAHATLAALTAEGFRLCVDDFGTGYSSLRYLNDLPLNSFKIDRSFVSNGSDDLANASIVEMLMMLSRSLELGVVAEGIETRRQWERLRQLGCRYGQGYYFARPLDAGAFTTWLASGTPLSSPAVPSLRNTGASALG